MKLGEMIASVNDGKPLRFLTEEDVNALIKGIASGMFSIAVNPVTAAVAYLVELDSQIASRVKGH